VQLVAARWTNVLNLANRGWPQLSQNAQLDQIMCPFWPMPLHRHVTWLPKLHISHNDLEKMADRFKGIRFY
jgi:hypothetical protein